MLQIRAFKKRCDFFKEALGSQQNWEEDTEISPYSSTPTQAQPPPLSTSPDRVIHQL